MFLILLKLFTINAAKSALHGCGKVVLEGHIKHCVRDGIEQGDADKTIENFTKAVERFANMGWAHICLLQSVVLSAVLLFFSIDNLYPPYEYNVPIPHRV